MKPSNQKSKSFKVVTILSALVIALGLMAFLPVPPVLAQSMVTAEKPLKQDYSRLEELFQREQVALERLAGFISSGEVAISRVQGLIDRGNANDLDTSALSAAISSFESSLATSQNAYGTAAGILASHAGFNGSGKVMDRDAALQTLKEAGAAMKSAGSTLKDASGSLRTAVQSWVQANKPSVDDRLSQLYQKTLEWSIVQGDNINKFKDAEANIQTLIKKAQERGEDTSNLENVIANITAQLPQSQSYHEAAVSILANHAGFDASGNVTNVATAKSTLESAKNNLDSSKNINISLAQEIKAAVEAWKVAHPKSEAAPDINGN